MHVRAWVPTSPPTVRQDRGHCPISHWLRVPRTVPNGSRLSVCPWKLFWTVPAGAGPWFLGFLLWSSFHGAILAFPRRSCKGDFPAVAGLCVRSFGSCFDYVGINPTDFSNASYIRRWIIVHFKIGVGHPIEIFATSSFDSTFKTVSLIFIGPWCGVILALGIIKIL